MDDVEAPPLNVGDDDNDRNGAFDENGEAELDGSDNGPEGEEEGAEEEEGDEGDEGEEVEAEDEEGSAEGAAATAQEDSVSDANRPRSRYEQERAALQRQIAELEEVNVGQKPWQLLGEVTGTKRPVGSLLELDLDHERAGKLPPVVTPEVTATLEDLVRRRIREQSFDDPVRQVLDEGKKWKPPAKLSDEKSKQSLSELYEQDVRRGCGFGVCVCGCSPFACFRSFI